MAKGGYQRQRLQAKKQAERRARKRARRNRQFLQWTIAVVVLALLGTILMFVGSALRSSDVERVRKPPGTI